MTSAGPIVIIINRFAYGGAERLVLDTVTELIRRGESVRVITVRAEGAAGFLNDESLPHGVHEIVNFSGPLDISAYIRLVRMLKRLRPRVVMTHLWFSNLVGRIAARIAGVRAVISFEHNVYDGIKTRRQFLADRLLQRLSRRVVAVSEPVRESLISHGIDASRIAVVQNGIDVSRLEPVANDRARLRSELGIPDDTFVYLFTGRLVRQKGCDVLLDAFATVGSGVLLVVGDGPLRAELEAQAASLRLGERVRFLGSRRDMRALFAAADCFVMPSRWEGLSIVLLEALAAGMPVVVTDFNSARSVLVDRVSGIIVPLEDVSAFADAMRDVRANEILRRSLAHAAHDAVQQYSIERHVSALLDEIRA